MKKFILLLGLLLSSFLFFGCLDTEPETANGTPSTQNLTAQYGDTLTVDYTLTVDSQVKDTSLLEAAKAAGTYDPSRSYQPFTFKMLLGGGTIPGFVNGILGMQIGQTKNFTVSPADAYGFADPKLISNLSRHYNMSVYEEVPLSFFEGKNVTMENGTVISSEIGYVGIHNISNSTVTLRYLLAPGHKFVMHGLPQTVVNVTNDTMLIRFDIEENKTYVVTDPFTNAQTMARSTYADNETIVLDENHPLAGKELNFEVTVRSIIRNQQ
jgi:FKBP-type peptidyl-prolyl cis-trans isomerase 2